MLSVVGEGTGFSDETDPEHAQSAEKRGSVGTSVGGASMSLGGFGAGGGVRDDVGGAPTMGSGGGSGGVSSFMPGAMGNNSNSLVKNTPCFNRKFKVSF